MGFGCGGGVVVGDVGDEFDGEDGRCCVGVEVGVVWNGACGGGGEPFFDGGEGGLEEGAGEFEGVGGGEGGGGAE